MLEIFYGFCLPNQLLLALRTWMEIAENRAADIMNKQKIDNQNISYANVAINQKTINRILWDSKLSSNTDTYKNTQMMEHHRHFGKSAIQTTHTYTTSTTKITYTHNFGFFGLNKIVGRTPTKLLEGHKQNWIEAFWSMRTFKWFKNDSVNPKLINAN